MLDLVTVGEAFDDFIFYNLPEIPAPGRELRTAAFARTIGGGAVITAVAAARLGTRCGIVSALSPHAAARLRREHVAVRNIRRGGDAVALTVALSTTRDRRFVTFDGGNDGLAARWERIVPKLCARQLHFAFQPRTCRPWVSIVEKLRQRGMATSWDFGWNLKLKKDRDFQRLCAAVDVLFLNGDEARAYATAQEWRRMPHPVVIKLGSKGARITGRGLDLRARPPRASVLDTTGAGDVFDAGFLVAQLRGASLLDALKLANKMAAKSTERVGGI